MKPPSPTSKPAVDKAEKEIGGVLEQLEQKTGGEVKDIGLEDVVDTDKTTGQPVLEKAVEINLQDKPPKRWSR
jgi:hypothetical protein